MSTGPTARHYTPGGSDGLPPLDLPAGSGVGCVTSGPFVKMSVDPGPVDLSLPEAQGAGDGPGTGLAYIAR